MNIRTFAIAAGAVALGLATWITPSKAQGPLWDVVTVNLPYSIQIGDRVLQPGEYRIQQNHDLGGGSRVLLIYSDNGMKFETSAMTIPCLDVNTARDTKVVLHHFGNDYYFDKIWIQGKDYGYEFPLPNSVKAREREKMEPISVAATYSTTQATETATNTKTTTTAAQTQATTAATTQATQPAETAQATPAPMTPAPTPMTVPPAPPENNMANREMPTTAANWLMMLLGGGSLSGLGLAIRRKR